MPLWSINVIVALLSFVIAAVFGKVLVPFLHKLKFGQPIKMKFGPEWHAKKQGTPTMGGILFIFSTAIAVGIGYFLYQTVCTNGTLADVTQIEQNRGVQMFSCMVFAILFGLIGFIDDFKKVVQKKNDGLSPMQKIVLQVVVAAGWLAVQYALGDRDTRLNFSFFSFDILVLLSVDVGCDSVSDQRCQSDRWGRWLVWDGDNGKYAADDDHLHLAFFAAAFHFYHCFSRRLSGLFGLESASCKVLYGGYGFYVSGCRSGFRWSGHASSPCTAAGCTSLYIGSPFRCRTGDIFQVYKEEVWRRQAHFQNDTDSSPL
jgi:hypothetical protein